MNNPNDKLFLNFDQWCEEFFDEIEKYENDFGESIMPVKTNQAFKDLAKRLYQEGKSPRIAVDHYIASLK